jgi:hypothetical protein
VCGCNPDNYNDPCHGLYVDAEECEPKPWECLIDKLDEGPTGPCHVKTGSITTGSIGCAKASTDSDKEYDPIV